MNNRMFSCLEKSIEIRGFFILVLGFPGFPGIPRNLCRRQVPLNFQFTIRIWYFAIWCMLSFSCVSIKPFVIEIFEYHMVKACFWYPWFVVNADILFSTLRPRIYGRHFPDDIFKRILFNENVWISIKIHWTLFLMVQLTLFKHWFR